MLDARIGETFWEACLKDDKEKINFILEKLEAPFFNECAAKYGWHRTNKALLQAAGFMHRRDRMPLKSINDTEYKEVEEVFKKTEKAINEFFGS